MASRRIGGRAIREAAFRRLGLRSLGAAPAPSQYSRLAGRRAAGPAPVVPRESGCSRRAGSQTQTRPEARTHARAAFQAVRLVQKLFPILCVETVDNSGICEPQALGTQAGTPDATLSRPGAVCHPERRECATKRGDAQRKSAQRARTFWRPAADQDLPGR